MTDKDWAKIDYDFNKTRKKLIRCLKKLDDELQLSSTVSGSECEALRCLIDYVKSRYKYASLNWKIVKEEGDRNEM